MSLEWIDKAQTAHTRIHVCPPIALPRAGAQTLTLDVPNVDGERPATPRDSFATQLRDIQVVTRARDDLGLL